MKIIEGMKKLRIIEKRMEDNCEHITEYSSSLSTYKPAFGSDDNQKKEVNSYIQANLDLMNEYLKIKQQIEKTNLGIKVEISGKTYSISELLVLKRKLAKLMEKTYKSLDDSKGKTALQISKISKEDKAPQVVKYYDEKEKNEAIREWQDLYNAIDSRLEIINATEELIEK